jgi:hypothetical protein
MVLAFWAVAISTGQWFPFYMRAMSTRYRNFTGFNGPARKDGVECLDLIG